MITSNRRHRKVDDFEPYYLTQTSVTLVKTLMSAKLKTYNAIGKVGFLLCSVGHVNDTDGDVFNMELKRLRQVFGPELFVRPSNVFGGPCKSVLDMISCISLGLRHHPTHNYIVLLEDDFLVTENFLPALNTYANRTEGSLLRLYTPSRAIAHDPKVSMYMSILYLFATLPSLITFCFIFSRIGKRGIRYLAATTVVIVLLLGLKTRSKPDLLTITPSTDLKSVTTGAAVVLPKVLAEILGHTDPRTMCASSNSVQSKADLVARAAMELKHGALDVPPPAVIHIGMYSQNRGYLHDPLLFPH
ncbi:unnamed protein product [Taenia asiatica]|uniref:Ceramide glucosyltransferase n=1 Tax=Taenia asiatica TaxID=60517 RepID=A0A0R3WDZ5_TAEAS|nr:unnamed protein product [Taenia asiatica]